MPTDGFFLTLRLTEAMVVQSMVDLETLVKTQFERLLYAKNIPYKFEDGELIKNIDTQTHETVYSWSYKLKPEKTFIVAGTQNEFLEYIKKDLNYRYGKSDTSGSMSDYVFVSGIDTLRGYQNPKGKFIGTFRNRKDLREIIEQIALASDEPNAKFADLYERILK